MRSDGGKKEARRSRRKNKELIDLILNLLNLEISSAVPSRNGTMDNHPRSLIFKQIEDRKKNYTRESRFWLCLYGRRQLSVVKLARVDPEPAAPLGLVMRTNFSGERPEKAKNKPNSISSGGWKNERRDTTVMGVIYTTTRRPRLANY